MGNDLVKISMDDNKYDVNNACRFIWDIFSINMKQLINLDELS